MKADYTGYGETLDFLDVLVASDANDVVASYTLARTWNYQPVPSFPPVPVLVDLPVVHLTRDVYGAPYPERPDVLFVCGIHPREWLTQEACLEYVERLVSLAGVDPAVDALLDDHEIWVLPMGSPGGRMYDETGGHGDPAVRRHRRKSIQWDQGYDCRARWSEEPHHGACTHPGDPFNPLAEWDGVNIARNFSQGWEFHESHGSAWDRSKILGAPAAIPELTTCKNNTQCANWFPDHPHCVIMDTSVPDPEGRCFVEPAFVHPTPGVALAHCIGASGANNEDSYGMKHQSCLRIPDDVFGSERYVLAECGPHGNWFNDPANPFVQSPWTVADHHQVCAGGVRVDCRFDGHCASLESAWGFEPPWQWSSQLYCKPVNGLNVGGSFTPGYCAYDRQQTCCDDNWKGTRPFETVEARLIRDLILNVPFVAVLDVHSYRSEMTYLPKGGGASGLDYRNGWAMVDQAVEAYNAAAQQEWQSRTGSGGDLPHFLSLRRESYGAGLGQLPGWVANYVSTATAFDDQTWRAINSFGIELPPYTAASDYADNAHYSSCGDGSDFCPGAQLMVLQARAGFAALADYLVRESTRPNLARRWDDPNRFAIPVAQSQHSDLALLGLQVNDGRGRGVIQGDLVPSQAVDEITLPGGRWAVSVDVAHRCSGGACPIASGPFPVIEPVAANVDIDVLRRAGGAWVPHRSFAIPVSLMNGSPATRVSRRVDLTEPGRYMFIARVEQDATITPGDHNQNLHNDEKSLVARSISCSGSAVPNGLDGDSYCGKRVTGLDDRFFCGDDPARCMECYLDGWGGQGCEELGADAFCVDGNCDTPEECWSATVEDGFENSADLTLYGDGAHTWFATLHLDKGQQDLDRVRFFANLPNSNIAYLEGGWYLNLDVQALCSVPMDSGSFGVRASIDVVKIVNGLPLAVNQDILPWTAPWPGAMTVALTAEQRAALFGGRPVVIEIRNLPDLGTLLYPSIAYRVSASLEQGATILPPDASKVVPVPGNGKVVIHPGDEVLPVLRIVPHAFHLGQGSRLFFLPDDPSGTMLDATEMLAVDAAGELAGRADEESWGLAVYLDTLVGLPPFEVRLENRQAPLSGALYHCPADAPDCSDIDPRREVSEWRQCGAGQHACPITGAVFLCRDVRGDPDNCGGCGIACGPGELCLEGVCAEVTSLDCQGTTCPDGLSCCEDANGLPTCVGLATSREDCGWCGRSCAANRRCHGALCLPRTGERCGDACGVGLGCCVDVLGRSRCVDHGTSAVHCGGCGHACGFGEVCRAGHCVPWLSLYDPCPFGASNCGAPDGVSCSFLTFDADNCGGCGLRCPEGLGCVLGRCTGDPGNAVPDACGMEPRS
jgi:hypothetical protein